MRSVYLFAFCNHLVFREQHTEKLIQQYHERTHRALQVFFFRVGAGFFQLVRARIL